MTKEKQKGQDSSLNPEPIINSEFTAEEMDSLYGSVDELRSENEELKLLLKESIENFKTKELADRIYKIPGIERPPLKPIKVKEDEEIPY